MNVYKHYTESFIKQTVDEHGEVKDERYTRDTKYTKNGKQGWIRMYKNGYDETMIQLKSTLEMNIFIYIRDEFTKNQEEVGFVQVDMAKKFNTTPHKINHLMRKLVDVGFLMKIRRGVYRMNPYILAPYQANLQNLQDHWDNIVSALNPKDN